MQNDSINGALDQRMSPDIDAALARKIAEDAVAENAFALEPVASTGRIFKSG